MLPTTSGTWSSGIDLPTRLFGDNTFGSDDYELYEEEGQFVLTLELPGFERSEIELAWDDGRLNVGAEHTDDARGRKRTYHRAFRFPKQVEDDEISATYRNGVLEVTLPYEAETETRGKAIPIEG